MHRVIARAVALFLQCCGRLGNAEALIRLFEGER
jgi:hypothetical protein